MLDASGNNTTTTCYFPVRLPVHLRAKLDQAHKLTGRTRASFLIEGAEAVVDAILTNLENTEAQSDNAAGLSFGSN